MIQVRKGETCMFSRSHTEFLSVVAVFPFSKSLQPPDGMQSAAELTYICQLTGELFLLAF